MLVGAGRCRIVGDQEDMICDVALEMTRA
ncbi:hypothetical protein HIR79_10245 [Halomonas sp. PGE1]|nr:hypothetical protein HIR79_10245 [Halomonas sp. PGE1]